MCYNKDNIFIQFCVLPVGANSVRPREINDLPYILRLRRSLHRHLWRIKHILNEDAVSRGGIVYEDVRYRADEFAVLNDRRAAHECGQEGTTIINRNLIIESIHRLKSKL